LAVLKSPSEILQLAAKNDELDKKMLEYEFHKFIHGYNP